MVSVWLRSGGDRGDSGEGRGGCGGDSGGGSYIGHSNGSSCCGDSGGGEDEGIGAEEVMVKMMEVVTVELSPLFIAHGNRCRIMQLAGRQTIILLHIHG